VPLIAETAWLIEAHLGPAAEASFLRSLSGPGLGRVYLIATDWDRVAELVEMRWR
jgi:hypothetical protein